MNFIKPLSIVSAVVLGAMISGCAVNTDSTEDNNGNGASPTTVPMPSVDHTVKPTTTCIPQKIPDCGDLVLVCGVINGCHRCGCG